MNYDQYGQAYTTEEELYSLLYKDPGLDLSLFHVDDPHSYNAARRSLYADVPELKQHQTLVVDLDQFDLDCQSHWHMPDSYKQIDIAAHVLSLCKTQPELQRVGQELLLYAERDLLDLLRYLKYFVDTMRANSVVWGLGRGSSVASYVLYLLGVHKINSLYYDLDIKEFLK